MMALVKAAHTGTICRRVHAPFAPLCPAALPAAPPTPLLAFSARKASTSHLPPALPVLKIAQTVQVIPTVTRLPQASLSRLISTERAMGNHFPALLPVKRVFLATASASVVSKGTRFQAAFASLQLS